MVLEHNKNGNVEHDSSMQELKIHENSHRKGIAHNSQKHYSQNFKDETEWIYMVRQPLSFKDQIGNWIFPPVHPTNLYDTSQYDNLPVSQQLPRIVFALEKLSQYNPHAFPKNEIECLSPTNMGMIQRLYSNALDLTSYYLVFLTFARRDFSRNNLFKVFFFVTAVKYLLKPLPLQIKEMYRYRKSKQLAIKYLDKHHGDLSIFKKILDPKALSNELHHMKI